MFKSFRIGVLALALLPVGGGVAAASPNVPDVSPYKDFDGWRLILSITDITIESVPNMAATPTTREGFVTATVKEKITRISDEAVTDNTKLAGGFLELKAAIGCQWASEGLTISPNTYPVGPNALTTVTPGAEDPASITVGATPNGDADSLFSWMVKPGTIVESRWDEKKVVSSLVPGEDTGGFTREISVEKERVDGENCGGPVAVRLEAHAKATTIGSDSHLNAYSDIVPL